MGIFQYPTPIPATVGNLPSLKFMITTDSLSTLTTAGYLNSSNLDAANPLSNTDIIMALYSYNLATTQGTFGIFTVAISGASGSITLTNWANPGDVLLPVVANDIAMFNGTTGQIYDGMGESYATNARHRGNIQAGIPGLFAGAFVSVPLQAVSGNFSLAAFPSSGDYQTVLQNAAMGQMTTFTIPDPGGATGQIAVAPAALVNGNLVQATGTAGLIANSGISAASLTTALKTQTAIVTLNTAAVNGMFAAPALIVAAPASGFALMPIACQIITVVSTAFTAGGVAQLQWGATVNAGGTVALDATTPTAEITAAASQIYTQYGVPTTTATAIATANGLGLYFSNATQAFATGTGSTVTVAVTYMIVPV